MGSCAATKCCPWIGAGWSKDRLRFGPSVSITWNRSAGTPADSRPAGQRGKVDYKEVLKPEEFAVFARLREVRKEMTQAEGVPVYTIFNNEQLAHMVQARARDRAALEKIAGGNANEPANRNNNLGLRLARLHRICGMQPTEPIALPVPARPSQGGRNPSWPPGPGSKRERSGQLSNESPAGGCERNDKSICAPVIELTARRAPSGSASTRRFGACCPSCWPRTAPSSSPSMRNRLSTVATINSPWPCACWPRLATWPYTLAWSVRNRRRFPAQGSAARCRLEGPRDPLQLRDSTPATSPVCLRRPPKPRHRCRTEGRAGTAGHAADRTLLPSALVQSLGLPQIGTIPIGGAGGITLTMPSYPVQVAIDNLPSQVVEVVASPGESWVLLGRDVVNDHRMLLDGPQGFLALGIFPARLIQEDTGQRIK